MQWHLGSNVSESQKLLKTNPSKILKHRQVLRDWVVFSPSTWNPTPTHKQDPTKFDFKIASERGSKKKIKQTWVSHQAPRICATNTMVLTKKMGPDHAGSRSTRMRRLYNKSECHMDIQQRELIRPHYGSSHQLRPTREILLVSLRRTFRRSSSSSTTTRSRTIEFVQVRSCSFASALTNDSVDHSAFPSTTEGSKLICARYEKVMLWLLHY